MLTVFGLGLVGGALLVAAPGNVVRVDAVHGERAAPAADGENAAPGVALPRLAGVVVRDGARQAIFSVGRTDAGVVVGEGERLGPFTVRSIRPGEVLLVDAARVYIVRTSPSAGVRDKVRADWVAVVPLVDAVRREAETENDQ